MWGKRLKIVSDLFHNYFLMLCLHESDLLARLVCTNSLRKTRNTIWWPHHGTTKLRKFQLNNIRHWKWLFFEFAAMSPRDKLFLVVFGKAIIFCVLILKMQKIKTL